MSGHYRLGVETEPSFSTDSSVPTYKRNEVYEREWSQWNRKTGLQRRKDMSMVWKYADIPGLLENLPGAGMHRPYGPLVRDAAGLFEDPWVRLRNEMDQQLQVVRKSYSSSKV